ncbi:hypothetical protein B296_00004416 [Ensete ventricosum]|uniref:Uncharacterized protein n=1 Tax=Ensete ventricosum TaxID=4639 RepID=A0A427AYK9_ENSVE|nr:hypothetical protein B296_00004416 [Ensete ventricosum]
MRLWAVIAVGGEEEMRRVRCGAVVADVDDSGCDWKQRRKKMVASSSGKEEQRWLAERGSGCCGNMRAAVAIEEGWQRLCGSDKGYEWWLCVTDNDDRQEEVAGTSMFGAAVVVGEMGIWWPTTTIARKKGGRV